MTRFAPGSSPDIVGRAIGLALRQPLTQPAVAKALESLGAGVTPVWTTGGPPI